MGKYDLAEPNNEEMKQKVLSVQTYRKRLLTIYSQQKHLNKERIEKDNELNHRMENENQAHGAFTLS